MAFLACWVVVDRRLDVRVRAVRVGVQEGSEAGDLVVVQKPRLDGDHREQRRAHEEHDQDPDRQARHCQQDEHHDDHDHRRPEVRLQQHKQDRDAGHDEQPEDVAPRQAVCLSARAIGRNSQNEREHGELRRLQLQGAQAEPARRTLGAAADHEHTQQGQDDQPVEDVGDRFEAPVVDQGDHDHDDDPQHDEEPLLLQEGLGILALGQQGAPGGRVDHHDADDRHQQRGDEKDEVERGDVAPGGNVCSGECGHKADSATEYRP